MCCLRLRACLSVTGRLRPTSAARAQAVTLIVDHLFLNHDIIRIQAETHPENTPAQKVLEKNGFTLEATLRKHTFSGGTWRDSALYSLLREEWTGPHYKW